MLSEMAPVAWQERDGQKIPVPVQYVLNDNLVSFTFPASYDASLQLTIDPTLVWGTFISGMSTDRSWDMTLDSQGNIIVTGLSVCWNYPLVNPVQGSGGYYDAIVSKLSPDGTTLLSSTCLGGNQNEWAWGATVDPQDNMIVTGSTQSSDFPIVAGLATFGGGTCWGEPCNDIFVAKLNPSGNAILYSSYLGGSGTDMANNVVADASGKIYIAGYTGSTNFPTTANAYSLTNHGVVNIAVAKFDPTLTGANSLVYSSYIGGNGDDRAEDIAIDNSGKISLTGYSNSGCATGFPSVNPVQACRAGSYDAFVIQMDLSLGGSAGVLFSSYFGGSGDDFAHSITLDGAGKVYITGNTKSSNFPTVNAYQTGLGGGCTTSCQDGFIAKLDPGVSQVSYSTYLGGANSEDLTAIAVDNAGRAYVTGYTQSSDYPQLNALMGRGAEGCSVAPCEDAVVTVLNPIGNGLVFSTYLSGSKNEEGQGVAVDAAGNILVSGWTISGDFPVANGYDVTLGIDGESDVFVVKIGAILPPTATPTQQPPTPTATLTLTLTPTPTATGTSTLTPTPTSTVAPSSTPTLTPISVSPPNCPMPGYCYFGTAIGAGDINGDGLQDVVIGAPQYTPAGAVFVYYGSPNGLSGTPDLVLQGSQPGDRFGWSVSAAGDVNGDGFGDVIVGAPGCTQSKTHEGCAAVYFGSASGLATTPAWSTSGGQAYASYGYAVGSAGDVNRDGVAEVWVGAPNYTTQRTHAGQVSVFYGARSGGLATTPAWTHTGDQADAYFGLAAAAAGDVNGDGFGDLIVGAPNASGSQSHSGAAFVFLGAAGGLAQTASWSADGSQMQVHFGEAVSTAGDLNGDGYSDVVIGAPDYGNGEPQEGAAFVYLGSATGLGTQPTWSGESHQAGAHYGSAVAAAGDVDHDGRADFLIGANRFSNTAAGAGKVYLYYGTASGVDGTRSWSVEGNQPYANYGYAISPAGDVKGNGTTDFLIAAPQMDNDTNHVDVGQVFLYSRPLGAK